MRYILLITLSLFLTTSALSADEFTISTYNCGCLSHHYDYLRGVSMQKLMQERYTAESENMALNDKIQQIALKILFSNDPQEKQAAETEWQQKGYQQLFERLTATPNEANSPNTIWNQKIDTIITNYKIRPVIIHDEEVSGMLQDHLTDLTNNKSKNKNTIIEEVRGIMAKRIFAHHLKFDIICLQEADYLHSSMFPENYDVFFSTNPHSVNGIAWNKDRFEFLKSIGDPTGRSYLVKLQDKTNGTTVLVASGHLSGCNPYRVENGDSSKGDNELLAIIELFNKDDADIKVIGMDSNVTSLHPRLNLLKEGNFKIDYENFLEPTCTNPHQVLNTRIDWITVQDGAFPIKITNIPVLGVGLNSTQTNISDHKPVAAKIQWVNK